MPIRYDGKLYRALNPVYAREPLSGKGAELHGGRFNARGVAALYTSLSVMTAIKEANQIGNLQPTTLVSYEAVIATVFDSGDDAALAAEGISAADLADPSWRDQMKKSGLAATQAFANRLIASGHHGLLVRSFAPGAGPNNLNLVLWTWQDMGEARLTLIDDENRLTR
jgi:RES domain-containing protein